MNEEIELHIRKNVTWVQLPSHVKQLLNNNPKQYDKHIITFSIKNQLRYRGNLVRHVFRYERRYYERVVAYSRERLMLFPYHLADMIVKGLRITPFNYYIGVLEKLMQAEKSYDTLPNFTAADCLRLLGIGRNEYIDLMNKCRSNRGKLFGRKNVRGLLPAVPCTIHIEPWWRVEVGLVLEDDIKMVTKEELEIIDKLIDFGSHTAGELNYNIVMSLYKRGLVYLDVPITAMDRVQVPPLQGFVMNRVLGDDYFETLLYKIFVSIDEHTTVGELASVLQVETELVKQAVSLYCRLKFARKLDSDINITQKLHPSWNNQPVLPVNDVDITPLTVNLSNTSLNEDKRCSFPSDGLESPNASKSGQRVAFVFDSTLTAFLMMGNLTPGLKKHAVTMFEVGKLCDESMDSFLHELEKVSVLDAEGEGEARRYFEHAVLLRSTVLALRKLPGPGLDLVRLESLHSLDDATRLRLLQKKYKLVVSMAPLSRELGTICTLNPPHIGPAVPEVNSLWFKLFIYHKIGYGPPSLLLTKGTVLKQLPRMFLGFTRLLVTAWLHEPAVIPVANILHVNAALQYSPVLIQAYGVHQVAQTQIIPFPFKDFKLGAIKAEHPALLKMKSLLDLEHNCGYLTFANIGILDFGCANLDNTVRLGKPMKPQSKFNPGSATEVTSISNENYSFEPVKSETDKLLSPLESHFALTPVRSEASSPANGFTNQECNDIMQEELDKLEQEATCQIKGDISSTYSFDGLLSPAEENITMFNQSIKEETEKTEPVGETWTLLDCQFGIPLFDVDANTKICDTIIYGGLTDPENLTCLVESSRKLGAEILDFISQCQYRPGENIGIVRRGQLIPLPKHNLAFDNGKLTEWFGK